MRTTTFSVFDYSTGPGARVSEASRGGAAGASMLCGVLALGLALLTWSVADPSLNHATNAPVHNLLGKPGAIAADFAMQLLGLACIAALAPPRFLGWKLVTDRRLEGLRLKSGSLSRRRRGRRGPGLAPSRARKLAAAERPRRGRRRRPARPAASAVFRRELGHGWSRRWVCDARNPHSDRRLRSPASPVGRAWRMDRREAPGMPDPCRGPL